MLYLFGALSKAWKRSRRGAQPEAPPQDASPQDNPYSYTVTVCSNEVALGRLIKRLSVAGAEHIEVAYAGDGAARVRMKRPTGVRDWDATVARLVDQCSLRCTGASTPGRVAKRKPARS